MLVRKHYRIVRHEKSKIEMNRPATSHATSKMMKAGTNGYWMVAPSVATSTFS